jgi:hypothetical protein
MRDIYTQAKGVVAWIGESDADTVPALDFIDGLSKAVRNDIESDVSGTRFSLAASWIEAYTSPGFKTCSWMAFSDLMLRPWWSRAWIVQEAISAQQIQIMCGNYLMPWEEFHLASSMVFTHVATILGIVTAECTNEKNPDEAQLLHTKIDRLCDSAAHVRTITTTAAERMKGGPQAFYDILRRHARAGATDPRDKVYGFLGLVDACRPEVIRIPIDYSLDPGELYRCMTREHLKAGKGLYILNDCYDIGRPEGFSSWSPPLYGIDWKPAGDLRFLQSAPHIIYNAATDLEAQFQFNGKTLLLAGVCFDTVKAVGAVSELRPGELIDGQLYTPLNVQRSWQKLSGFDFDIVVSRDSEGLSAQELLKMIGLYPGGQILNAEAWLRTTLANPSAPTDGSYLSQKSGIDGAQRWANNRLDPDGMNDEHLWARAGAVCIGRRCYITSRGYFGLGPPVTSVGDVVCVFLGGRTPFLIRPQEDTYEIVSESYVHGLMSGELVAEIKAGNIDVDMIALQ